MQRVQIPAYTDRWMMGDRYGDVVRQDTIVIGGELVERATVKLDKSGKRVRVLLDDCTPVDQDVVRIDTKWSDWI